MEVEAQVRFIFKDGPIEQLFTRAAELDEEGAWGGVDIPETYTLAQALQIVWHQDPDWLHANVLMGWVMEKAKVKGTWRDVWPGPTDEGE